MTLGATVEVGAAVVGVVVELDVVLEGSATSSIVVDVVDELVLVSVTRTVVGTSVPAALTS